MERKLNLTKTGNITLITIYDNYQHNPKLKTGWGFSCLVKTKNKNILFDMSNTHQKLMVPSFLDRNLIV